jgi:hypothetical protein
MATEIGDERKGKSGYEGAGEIGRLETEAGLGSHPRLVDATSDAAW